MSTKIKFSNDVSNAEEEAKGSDGRFNVSSRSDSRAYYNSRDEQLVFSVAWNFNTAEAGEYAVYWRNASDSKTLVIDSIGLNGELGTRFKLWYVTGTATSGTELTPINLNKSSSRAAPDDAVVMAMEGGSAGTGIGGLSTDGLIDFVTTGGADGHEELRLKDRLRLGQNDAIAIEVDELTTTAKDVFGVIFGYYE